jgi:hypothetical protein
MSKIKVCVSLVALFLWMHPLSYADQSVGYFGQLEMSADPIVDANGNLLLFRTLVSKTSGVETEVTLISPAAAKSTQTYSGLLTPIRKGEKGVYAIRWVRSSSGPKSSAAQSLVALVPSSGTLPKAPVEFPFSGSFALFRIASRSDGGSDVIYLGQRSSSGPSVLVLSFDGTAFSQVSASPVPLP